jgi:hypothetical protein
MDLILASITIGLVIYSARLYVMNLDNKKQIEQAIKEYKHLKDDYFELLRDLKDEKNKNFLLQSVIKQLKK